MLTTKLEVTRIVFVGKAPALFGSHLNYLDCNGLPAGTPTGPQRAKHATWQL